MNKIMNRIVDGGGRAKDIDMLLELEKTMGIMPGTTICGLADGTAWATRTFVNKFYDEFAAACPEPTPNYVGISITRGNANVSTPMGSNTR
jgi:NADH-quinone oxidoreductase subunit F